MSKLPRWPQTPDELTRFAAVQQALGAFMADKPFETCIRIALDNGDQLEGELHGCHTRTSVSYPINHAATLLVRTADGVREIDFLDVRSIT